MFTSSSISFGILFHVSIRKLNGYASPKASAIFAKKGLEQIENVESRSAKFTRKLQKHGKTPAFMIKNPQTYALHVQTMAAKFGVSLERIFDYPGIIYLTPTQFEYRYNILRDYGFPSVTCGIFSNITSLMRMSPTELLDQNLLPVDPIENVLQLLPKEIEETVTKQLSKKVYMHWPLVVIHKGLIALLLSTRLQCSYKEALLTLHCRSITKRSIVDLYETIIVLNDFFGFSIETLKNTPMHLTMNVKNMRKIALDPDCKKYVSTLCQQNPILLRKETYEIQRVFQFCIDNGITEEQLSKCKRVYSIPIETLKHRLAEIDDILEFRILKADPYFLNLLVYMPVAKRNLERMKLSGHTAMTINKYQRKPNLINGGDSCRGREAVRILARALDKPEEDVNKMLRVHPKFKHISYVNTHLLIEGLVVEGVTLKQLSNAVFIVLYNREVVLDLISKMKAFDELQPFEQWRNDPLFLHLVAYYIEKNCGFSFEGIYLTELV